MHQRADHSYPSNNAGGLSGPTARILVVDPDEDTRALYHQSLASIHCDVVDASDGRDALVKALAGPVTLVVTEVRLPFVDGFGLCDVLRRDPATADVPILVITSEGRPAEIDRARRMGADAVLVKPTTPEHILAETRRLLADASARRGRAAPIQTAALERAPSEPRPARLSKTFARVTTTTPPSSPPVLVCPSCDSPLTYEQSYLGGVNERHLEQWDRFDCPASCGAFEYRHRTRKLRFVERE
jgi:CheY-like chemotaxis protein